MDAPPVQYVKTSDGYDIAFSVSGDGLPFVFMPPPTSHIQLEWSPPSQVTSLLQELSGRFRLVRYDGRGQGMSRRDLAAGYSMDALQLDLEAIVDKLQLERFVLMGSHASGHAAVRYAVDNPEQLHALVIAGSSTSGSGWPVISAVQLAERNWEYFLSMYMMAGPLAQEPKQRVLEYLNQLVTQRDWTIMAKAWTASDIADCLPSLQVPTLILHPVNYMNVPVQEAVDVASRINNARIVRPNGSGILGEAKSTVRAIDDFLAELSTADIQPAVPGQRMAPHGLSARQIEVLRLVSTGHTNPEIAEKLVISIRTVERHLSEIYAKIGARNRADAAIYALTNL